MDTSEPTQGTCDECHRLHLLNDVVRPGDPSEMARQRAIEAAARQWFEAHLAHVADQRDRLSPVGEQAMALRRLAQLLAAR
jgi:hypothetical protein